MATQQERTAASRQAIIDAARRLFLARRTVDLGLGDIAEEAGVSRPNIHYHFGSRLDLLSAVAYELAEEHDVFTSDPTLRDAASYVSAALRSQMRPEAFVLHLIGDVLTLAHDVSVEGHLTGLVLRLEALGCEGDALIVAAAMTLFARQVAFGYYGETDIDRFVDGLVSGVAISGAPVSGSSTQRALRDRRS